MLAYYEWPRLMFLFHLVPSSSPIQPTSPRLCRVAAKFTYCLQANMILIVRIISVIGIRYWLNGRARWFASRILSSIGNSKNKCIRVNGWRIFWKDRGTRSPLRQTRKCLPTEKRNKVSWYPVKMFSKIWKRRNTFFFFILYFTKNRI